MSKTKKNQQSARERNEEDFNERFDELCRIYEGKFMAVYRNSADEPVYAAFDSIEARDISLAGLDKEIAKDAYLPNNRMPEPNDPLSFMFA